MIYLFSNTTLQNHKFLVVNNKVELGERKSKDANKCKQIKKSDTILTNNITKLI